MTNASAKKEISLYIYLRRANDCNCGITRDCASKLMSTRLEDVVVVSATRVCKSSGDKNTGDFDKRDGNKNKRKQFFLLIRASNATVFI